ncbi:MAG: carboxypeptidase-like regulatory domain-containing protein [Flavobacteriaceae bacterium]|nr:carboxypeptidase-like regulatory domain-containing protein [Flavobacteriaceae bacterium]
MSGRIMDAETGDPIPFASVVVFGKNIKTATDFEGRYKLKFSVKADSIKVAIVGYEARSKAVVIGTIQVIDFQLKQSRVELTGMVIKPKANRALIIIDSLLAHRRFNDPAQLESYECENFNKLELAVNNISKDLKNNPLAKKLGAILDTANHLAGEDGRPVLPVFISESVTDFYLLKNPYRVKEYIKATKITGVGVEDGSTISQLTGSVFQEYNFYDNWIKIIDKQLPSPVGKFYKQNYYLRLMDSSEENGRKVWEISIRKRRKNDLQFSGTVWIEEGSFAMKRIVLEVDKSANLNFIEKIGFQQEFEPTKSGCWMPVRTRLIMDIDQVTKFSAGILAKYYTTSSKIIPNKQRPLKFFDERIEVAEDSKLQEDSFWLKQRLSLGKSNDERFLKMVDSLKELPVIKTYVDYVELLVGGYKRIGKIDIGPYIQLYNNNIVEGHRFRLGIKSNYTMNRNFYWRVYGAYALKDQRWKFGGGLDYVLKRKPWNKIVYDYKNDVEAVGLIPSDISTAGNLFTAVSLFSRIGRWGYVSQHRLMYELAPAKGFTTRLKLEHKRFTATEPYGGWNFDYLYSGIHTQNFTNANATAEIRYCRKDIYIQNDNDRINVGDNNRPIYLLAYTKGAKNVLGSQFDYHKLRANIQHTVFFRRYGTGYYQVSFIKFFGALPYPLLDVQYGNQSFIYNSKTFNLMRFCEFVSDQSLSGEYEHHFEGLFFNRIPVVKKWKLRLFANGRMVWGSISQKNLNLIPKLDDEQKEVTTFRPFNNIPYAEVGYGIENIFKVLRVDFVHRLTYLDSHANSTLPVRPFGVRLSLQFKF